MASPGADRAGGSPRVASPCHWAVRPRPSTAAVPGPEGWPSTGLGARGAQFGTAAAHERRRGCVQACPGRRRRPSSLAVGLDQGWGPGLDRRRPAPGPLGVHGRPGPPLGRAGGRSGRRRSRCPGTPKGRLPPATNQGGRGPRKSNTATPAGRPSSAPDSGWPATLILVTVPSGSVTAMCCSGAAARNRHGHELHAGPRPASRPSLVGLRRRRPAAPRRGAGRPRAAARHAG